MRQISKKNHYRVFSAYNIDLSTGSEVLYAKPVLRYHMLTSLELCAGAGGQALGVHLAGFKHVELVEIDAHACETLNLNSIKHSLNWPQTIPTDLTEYRADHLLGKIDLVAGGVPCPPFSKAGKQLGKDDERDMFPHALRVINTVKPNAIMLENVAGLMEPKFAEYREHIQHELSKLGYQSEWKLLQASDYGVPQLRPRVVLVAMLPCYFHFFRWPEGNNAYTKTVGEALLDLMASNGWKGAEAWAQKANKIAPTLVGGSKKHGGPDLGPTRAKAAWRELGVNGHRLADTVPGPDFAGEKEGYENMPLLTVRMAARIQGFPDWWEFFGKKTHSYRQVGNAFPPPVAQAVAQQIANALLSAKQTKNVSLIVKDPESA